MLILSHPDNPIVIKMVYSIEDTDPTLFVQIMTLAYCTPV